MKKAAIITIYGNYNYGNKLQNYAVQEVLKEFDLEPITIKNKIIYNKKTKYISTFLKERTMYIYHHLFKRDGKKYDNSGYDNPERNQKFFEFDKLINKTKDYFNYFKVKKFKDYDIYVVGSDQVWNPTYGCLNEFDLLDFVDDSKIKISLAASFGIKMEKFPQINKEKIAQSLMKFDAISVRENEGKEIIENITGKNDAQVLIDPTMMLTTEQWDEVSKKPIQFNENKYKNKKFIFTYFLGGIPEKIKEQIDNIAKELDYNIINIFDKDDPFYTSGPSEFLWLEKNSSLTFTDSFHSSVFAILYHVPLVVYDKGDNTGSRLRTLLKKFKMEDRLYISGSINSTILNADYKETDIILESERNKVIDFLNTSIKDNRRE